MAPAGDADGLLDVDDNLLCAFRLSRGAQLLARSVQKAEVDDLSGADGLRNV